MCGFILAVWGGFFLIGGWVTFVVAICGLVFLVFLLST